MSTVYRFWAGLVFVAVVVQIGFAGYGAFFVANKVDKGVVNQSTFDDGFSLHAGFGYLVVLAGLVLLLIALAGRLGRPRVVRSAALFGLLILQVLLAWFGFAVPAIGFFHPINAMAIFALSGLIAHTAWLGRMTAAPPAVTA